MSSAADSSAARLRVTAVVVAHDGAAWLPRLLAALAESSRAPDLTIGVDTGSVDDSLRLLRHALGPDRVLELDRRTGFGAAVAAGLAPGQDDPPSTAGRHAEQLPPAEEWIWLLHDDCVPAPDALERLLEIAVTDPRIAVVGCRIRAWPRGRRLLEVGVTITGTGRRETGLEPAEYDQGQYDQAKDVLAVSTAGMLVRRSRWETLGGLDPRLPLFRDDIDLGWRAAAAGHRVVVAPAALLFHAEASSRGVRSISSTRRRPHQADRRAAILTVLANSRAPVLPLVYVRLLLGSLLRALGFLLGKLPRAAWDEVAGAAAALARPGQLLGARRWRREQRPAGPVSVRPLLAPWWTPYADGLDVVLTRGSETFQRAAVALSSSTVRQRPVPTDSEDEEAAPRRDGPLATVTRHPLLTMTSLLTLASLVASRGLWGSGYLQGGALLPAPGGAGDWWELFSEVRHQVGAGSDVGTAPYVALLAAPGAILLGKAWLVVDLLMLFAPVLAGFGAWAGSGRLARSRSARLWMSVGYALLPVLTGAVTSGHVGTVAVAVLLPWVARSACRILDLRAAGRWGAAWATGLTLTVATAFAPVCWPIAAGVGVVAIGWLALRGEWARLGQWLVALAVPVGLLAPWSWRVITHPALMLTEAGAVDVPGSPASNAGWHLAFLRIGAAGEAPWWISAGVVVVALVALLRPDSRGRVVGAWVVVAAGLGAAAVMSREAVTAPAGAGQAYAWLGVPLIVAGAGAVAAAGIAGDGLRSYVQSGSFGWRQPLALVAVLIGLSVPVLGLGWWAGFAPHGDLHRAAGVPLPAYMVDSMSSTGARVLVLRTGTSTVRYRILSGDGLRLGDDSVLPSGGSPRLAAAIADVLSQRQPKDLPTLAAMGIRYVVLPSPQSSSAVAHLDALAGLRRTSTEQTVLSGWQVGPGGGSQSASAAEVGTRSRLVVTQGVLWTLVIVLAAPGIRRRPLDAVEAS